ncbi:MAG: hypothetical protein IKR84_01000 [Oscillibacter sp.]|nr:hypothetical protein [Oscillibacter sp.]
MSRSAEYDYELERERRRRIAAERVSNTTETFYRRYREQFEELRGKGAFSLIPDEMARLESDLGSIRNLLSENPFEAREISRAVGGYIYGLHGLARTAEREFDRALRLRAEAEQEERERRQDAAMDAYYRQIQGLSPAVVNFAIEELQALQKEIAAGRLTGEAEIQARVASAARGAETRAAEWKRSAVEAKRKEALEKRVQAAEEFVSRETWEDSQKAREFRDRIARLRADLDAGEASAREIEQAAEDIEAHADEEKISEEVRRQAVMAIMRQLRAQEFVVGKPELFDNAGETYVKITAQQPSGKRVQCRIDLRGKIRYRFDRYEGMTCLKDIERFNVDLERVYSIKLSDERVIWENPDRLSMDQNRMPSGTGERSGKA